MKRLSDALGVSRSHLSESLQRAPRPRSPYHKTGDAELLARIEVLVAARPSYGYRRITALLNRGKKAQERVNHKRVYRVMRNAGLLLPKYSGKVERPHEGQVITLKSDLRWCSDMFEIRCWNGDKVHVAFSLDCCDRESISWVAAPRHLDGSDVRDLMAQSVEARFGSTQCPHPVEWLSDNGPPYTAHETRSFGASCTLRVRNTPAYSPESNGMAEAFVKTFKRDYVYLADLWDAETVLRLLPTWFADYNDNHPHKGLKMMSPKEFRRGLAV
jgi:transposase InsO family protein